MMLEDALDHQKDTQVGPGANKRATLLKAKMTTEAVPLRTHHKKESSLGKTLMLGKIGSSRKRRPNTRWIDSIKEARGMSLQELIRAVKDRTLWTSLILRVPRSWSL